MSQHVANKKNEHKRIPVYSAKITGGKSSSGFIRISFSITEVMHHSKSPKTLRKKEKKKEREKAKKKRKKFGTQETVADLN